MIYLSEFTFPNYYDEEKFLNDQKRTCYTTFYPFGMFGNRGVKKFEFASITILYGGNGSGKTTILNVIAEKLKLDRDSLYNKSNFFEDYIGYCEHDLASKIPSVSKIITSDDVFDYMLNIRAINSKIDVKREDLFEDYIDKKYSTYQLRTLDDYEELKKHNMAKKGSQSKYVKDQISSNLAEHSNGESAYMYFLDNIKEGGLYLLDEPENSLSPEKQLELVQFIENSARFFNCQFIIATHSPFVLALKDAKIYNLDSVPPLVQKWTTLPNVRAYYNFFEAHKNEF